MKYIVVVILFFVILIGSYIFFAKKSSPSQLVTGYCAGSALEGSISTEGAAGSVYGTLTLKNISSSPCQIMGSNYIEADYSAENIVLSKQDGVGDEVILLVPQQSVYSKVRYQNGPQCSSPLPTTIVFRYKFSPSESIRFKDITGDSNLPIVACSQVAETTQVSVWSISSNP